MTAPFDLRTMAVVLRQGARLNGLSRGALLAAVGWLVAAIATAHPPGSWVACALSGSIVAGLAQIYVALRVAVDAALLDALADQMIQLSSQPTGASPPGTAASPAAAAMLDRSLRSLGLLPEAKAGRGWPARWAGAQQLLRRQVACLGAQLVMLIAAIVISLIDALTRTMPA